MDDGKFFVAIRYNEIISKIIETASNVNDPADFGIQVAELLFREGLLYDAVYQILSGKESF